MRPLYDALRHHLHSDTGISLLHSTAVLQGGDKSIQRGEHHYSSGHYADVVVGLVLASRRERDVTCSLSLQPTDPLHRSENNYFLCIENHSYFTISKVPWGLPIGAELPHSSSSSRVDERREPERDPPGVSGLALHNIWLQKQKHAGVLLCYK